ncbi:MAG TPA: flavodoxin [Candidatus Anaerotruncus excrementipullorum]|uniref:Flavodoxin n=1 Tax=Candidatus Anaerotruncus excrementipullorum TaxID=2838465 RepID=A0A9D2B7U1_9FIRM|nr:flavodoxin [Candidatus Anaerotruncus excrementipullorum]
MSKIAVVYWSGTGNTKAMADAVAEGVNASGGEATLLTAAEFDPALLDSFGAVAFGCPSMGSEELEESEFAPMFEGCVPKLSGRKIALFGSYGWGDGEWMRTWEENCRGAGAVLACEPVICNEAPDDDALAACQALGKALV